MTFYRSVKHIACVCMFVSIATNQTCMDHDVMCSLMTSRGECVTNATYMGCTCPLSCASTATCNDSTTDDVLCSCRADAQEGKFEMDNNTYSVNCSTTFDMRQSVTCPAAPPQQVTHGKVRNSTLRIDYHYMDQVLYDCNVGYRTSGSSSAGPTLTCDQDGTWIWGYQAHNESCTLIDCDTPDDHPPFTVQYVNTTFNHTAIYTCMSSGEQVIATCSNESRWDVPDGSDNVTCSNTTIDPCMDEEPACKIWADFNECVTYPQSWMGCACVASCQSTTTCSPNATDDVLCSCRSDAQDGKFETDNATYSVNCSTTFNIRQNVTCDETPPMEILHGKADNSTLKRVYRYMDQVKYDCDSPAYYSSGYMRPTVTCYLDGTWLWGHFTNNKTCVLIDCGVPTEYPLATALYTSITYGYNTTYTCPNGEQVIAMCGVSRKWEFPQDINVTCADLQTPIKDGDSGPTEASGAAIIGVFGIVIMVAVIGSVIVLDCTSCPKHFSLGWRNTRRFRKWLREKLSCNKNASKVKNFDNAIVESDVHSDKTDFEIEEVSL